MSPAKKRRAIKKVCSVLKVSVRRACRVLGQPRATQRYRPKKNQKDAMLRKRIIDLACKYGRYGYRRITALLCSEGWHVNHKKVERIWRQEGLKVPMKQPKRRRLWFNDGSCVRLRPEKPDHVWSYDIVEDRTSDGRKFRILNIIDEHTRECLAIKIGRQLKAEDVQEILFELFMTRRSPDHIRSDNGSEFTAKSVRVWLNKIGVKTLFIEPGSPWENGYIESFNGKMRDELLNGEIFDTLWEAQILINNWRKEYNTIRPHSSLNYKPPVPATKELVSMGTLNLKPCLN